MEKKAVLHDIRTVGGLVAKLFLKLVIPQFGYQAKLVILVLMILCGFTLWDQMGLREEAVQALVRIDPLPHTRELIAQGRYAEADEYLTFFLGFDYVAANPEATALAAEIQAIRTGYRYRFKKAVEGAIYGQSDELEGQLAAVLTDFLVIGDLRDLTLQGLKWYQQEEVDEFVVALSTIGVVATAGTIVTAGTSETVKPALSFLKIADKVHEVPKWLRTDLIQSVKVLRTTKRLDHVTELFDSIYRLFKASGVRGTLVVLHKADDAESLAKLTKFGATFGAKTAVLVEIAGDTGITVFNTMNRLPKEVFLEAATYGERGMATLKQAGLEKFRHLLRTAKLASRTTKIVYTQYPFLVEASRALLRNSLGFLPAWLLWGMLAYGGVLLGRR